VLALIRDGEHDPPVAHVDVPEPEPGPDEALIQVRASSLNRGELALFAVRADGWRRGQDLAGSSPRRLRRVRGRVQGHV
jgi:NADPH:quinone reductase-like Zn-dependent oxidoreductase